MSAILSGASVSNPLEPGRLEPLSGFLIEENVIGCLDRKMSGSEMARRQGQSYSVDLRARISAVSYITRR
jgi:hypothetical protein